MPGRVHKSAADEAAVAAAGPDTAPQGASPSLPATAAHGLGVPAGPAEASGPVFGPDAGVVGSARSDRVSST
jgi:hypothetical protein